MTLLHHIYQRHHQTPDEVYSKPPKIRAFMFSSTMVQLEAEAAEQERIKNMMNKK